MASTHPPPAAGLWCARHLTSTRRRTPPKRLAAARASAPPSPVARAHQPTCAAMATGGERQPGIGPAGACASRGALAAPRTAAAGGGHAARSSALDAPSSAVGRRASGRARRGAVAAVLPHWDDDDDRLPGGRLTRALPPRANGHDGGAWCERRNRAASARWAPRSPGQPASRLHPHALRRAAFDNFGSDRRGLRARHAVTHAQSNTRGARGLKVRPWRDLGPDALESWAPLGGPNTRAAAGGLLAGCRARRELRSEGSSHAPASHEDALRLIQ